MQINKRVITANSFFSIAASTAMCGKRNAATLIADQVVYNIFIIQHIFAV